MVYLRLSPCRQPKICSLQNCFAPKSSDFEMIFGAKEEIIPKYYDDDKPKSVQKTSFGLVRIILLWLTNPFVLSNEEIAKADENQS